MYQKIYKNQEGARGLVVYTKEEIITKRKIIELWESIFIDKDVEYIDGPVLTPVKVLEDSGHLDIFNKDNNEIYRVNETLCLRPETCTTIFSYYKEKYGTRLKNTAIAQVGKSFRNEKSTRAIKYRLNEFTQLELEYFHAEEKAQHKLVLDNVEYLVSTIFLLLKVQSDEFFEKLGIKIKYKFLPQTERAFYSKMTLDVYTLIEGKEIELGCINDRNNHDISKMVYVTELSMGLDRIIAVGNVYN
jgi:glycyl-tRNA synthetase (class II)